MSEYRIDYTIKRAKSEDAPFRTSGFGSSSSWENIDAALYAITTDIQRREWETSGRMPDPGEVDDH